MIRIHRRRPYVRIGERAVKLTPAEHELITALGMMDNKLTPHQLLLDIMCADQARQIPADKQTMQQKLARLRKKIGRDRLQCQRHQGYILLGDVQFYG